MAKKVRLQFDFTEDQVKALDALVNATDSASRAEVIRRAVNLMSFSVNKTLFIKDESGVREIVLL